jgi:hypothetical protein
MTFQVIIPMSVAIFLAPFVCRAQSDHQSSDVEALLAQLGAATNFSTAYVTPDTSSRDYKRMVDQLRAASPKTLRLLMEEVTNISVLEKGHIYITNGDLAYRAYRLSEAFKIAGTNAAPLFPELRSEFLSGRSAWGAECGLSFVGSDAWPVFLQGLTNSEQRVQVAAMSGISEAPSSDALAALPYLCGFATNQSKPPEFRDFADRCIGTSHIKPQAKVPSLVKIGETETNWEIKVTIIYFIGEYGGGNKEARDFLERTSKDKNRWVRSMSEKALRELEAAR